MKRSGTLSFFLPTMFFDRQVEKGQDPILCNNIASGRNLPRNTNNTVVVGNDVAAVVVFAVLLVPCVAFTLLPDSFRLNSLKVEIGSRRIHSLSSS